MKGWILRTFYYYISQIVTLPMQEEARDFIMYLMPEVNGREVTMKHCKLQAERSWCISFTTYKTGINMF